MQECSAAQQILWMGYHCNYLNKWGVLTVDSYICWIELYCWIDRGRLSPEDLFTDVGCVRLASLGRPLCVAVFFPRTNVGNYLYTFVLEKENATHRVDRGS